jgi:hypothetical protein
MTGEYLLWTESGPAGAWPPGERQMAPGKTPGATCGLTISGGYWPCLAIYAGLAQKPSPHSGVVRKP